MEGTSVKPRRRVSRRKSDPASVVSPPVISEEKKDLITHLQLPPDVEASVRAVDIFSAMVIMRDGSFLLKYPRYRIARKPHSRLFRADADNLTLRWMSPAKSKRKTFVSFSNVIEINSGWNSKFWKLKRQRERKLGIEIVTKSRYLRLVASNQNEWKLWIRGLVYIQERAHAKQRRSSLAAKDDGLRRIWASVLGSVKIETINLHGLVKILKQLNYHSDSRYVETLFKLADEDGSQRIDYGGFQEVILRLGCPAEIGVYYKEYKEPTKDHMTAEEGFELFLKDVQQEPEASISGLSKIVESMSPPFAEQGNLTELGFAKLLMSDWNSIYNPLSTSQTHDMSRPLSQYWISGCLDPFSVIPPSYKKKRLTMGSQLVFALLDGYRFLKLLVKDGPGEDPVLTNDRDDTLPLKKALTTIKYYAFVASPFPLILHIKPSCSGKQIARLGITIEDMLKGSLYIPKTHDDPLPSPEDLIKKIVIISASAPDGEGLTVEDKIDFTLRRIARDEPHYGAIDWIKRPPCPDAPAFDPMISSPITSPTESAKILREQHSWFQKVVALHLSAWPISFPVPDISSHECRSISFHALGKRKENKADIVAANKSSLGLAYPENTAELRTNVGFVRALVNGFQLIPLSQQAGGFTNIIQKGLFAENAMCGYVLRPPSLNLTPHVDPRVNVGTIPVKQAGNEEGAVEMGIKVLCGFQLPRGPCSHPARRIKRHQPDTDDMFPYVVLSTVGADVPSVIHKTKVVPHNGLDPQWRSKEFLFPVTSPATTFLNIEIMHHDLVKKYFLGGASVRVSCIRPGLRWVTLYDSSAKKIPWSGLLVVVTFKAMKLATTPDARSKITVNVKPQLAVLKFQLEDPSSASPSVLKSPSVRRRKQVTITPSPKSPSASQVDMVDVTRDVSPNEAART